MQSDIYLKRERLRFRVFPVEVGQVNVAGMGKVISGPGAEEDQLVRTVSGGQAGQLLLEG